jgi:hypothetical protein
MKGKDGSEQAREQGAAWARIVAQASGLKEHAVVTREEIGEEQLEALGQTFIGILSQLAEAVEDLVSERGEAFARAFEQAAREEIAAHS